MWLSSARVTTSRQSFRRFTTSLDYLKASSRWRERLAAPTDAINADLIPLTSHEWETLLQQTASTSTKKWLASQTGVIRVPKNLIPDVAPLLPGFPSKAEEIVLLKQNSDSKPSEGGFMPPSNQWQALANARSKRAHRVQGLSNVDAAVDSYLSSCYSFDHYISARESHDEPLVKLQFPNVPLEVQALMGAIYWTQDLISTPANDLTPGALQHAAQQWANSVSGVEVEIVLGDKLLTYNGCLSTHHGCGMIHAVGRGAKEPDREPRLIILRYRPQTSVTASRLVSSSSEAPIALVGKGVTFDTGGLNLKPGTSMTNMKKDMGGAALALGLMRVLVERGFTKPIDCWIPAVENVVDGNSYRPGDILRCVNGTTTEIGNTDAEGRLILADTLVLASAIKPELIIDFATLTGAQRVALGLDIPAIFGNKPELMPGILEAAKVERDPIWQLPLWEGYRKRVKSKIADYRNVPNDSDMGGAITAALYLSEFVREGIPWLHIDFNGLDTSTGLGQAPTLRAMNSFLWDHYAENK